MAHLINFQDAVDASVLDPNATHAVYYMDGHFQNEQAVRARCPHAKLYAITVRGATGHGVFACDSETGDLDIPQTEQWVATQVSLGVFPTVVYANRDRWLNLGLLNALAKYGHHIERWDADFDGNPIVPLWADAKQYRSTNVDSNVALANFFDAPPPRKPDDPNGHAALTLTPSGVWTIHGTSPGSPINTGKNTWAAEVTQRDGAWGVFPLPFSHSPH